jgi:hypothetical protein
VSVVRQGAARRLAGAGDGGACARPCSPAARRPCRRGRPAAGKSKTARRDLERARLGLRESNPSPAVPHDSTAEVADAKDDIGPITPFAVEEWS